MDNESDVTGYKVSLPATEASWDVSTYVWDNLSEQVSHALTIVLFRIPWSLPSSSHIHDSALIKRNCVNSHVMHNNDNPLTDPSILGRYHRSLQQCLEVRRVWRFSCCIPLHYATLGSGGSSSSYLFIQSCRESSLQVTSTFTLLCMREQRSWC